MSTLGNTNSLSILGIGIFNYLLLIWLWISWRWYIVINREDNVFIFVFNHLYIPFLFPVGDGGWWNSYHHRCLFSTLTNTLLRQSCSYSPSLFSNVMLILFCRWKDTLMSIQLHLSLDFPLKTCCTYQMHMFRQSRIGQTVLRTYYCIEMKEATHCYLLLQGKLIFILASYQMFQSWLAPNGLNLIWSWWELVSGPC